jgi:hypothetical protein
MGMELILRDIYDEEYKYMRVYARRYGIDGYMQSKIDQYVMKTLRK